MKRFEMLEQADENKWNSFFEKIPPAQRDIYFGFENYKLYAAHGDGKAQCAVFEEGDGIAIYPFLINSVNELGYDLPGSYFDIQGAYGYNGVMTNSYEAEFIESFYAAFNQYCSEKKIIAEFTRFHPLLDNRQFSSAHLQTIHDRQTVALDLKQPYESIWTDSYSSQNRNMIRKAGKLNYHSNVITHPSKKEIDVFYAVYKNSMTNVQADAYYFFNQEYFYNLFSFFAGNAILLNVLDGKDEVVCSSVFLNGGYYFHYHLSGRTGNADNSVNNFLLDEAVKYAQSLGATQFHFGGGRSVKEDDSLLKFKRSFSKTGKDFFIGKKVHNERIYNEVVRQWEQNHPEKKEKLENHLLKYRAVHG